MTILTKCSRCVLPETHETIQFNSRGECNICRNVEFKSEKIDWEGKKAQLDELIEGYRGRYNYDCIVPFSGGKDSTYTLWYLVKVAKVKPLVVCFDHGFLRNQVMENATRTMKILGVEFHKYTPNWHLVKKLMLQSLMDKGDFCWHCHTGIFAYPMWVALQQKVPLVFWGEPSAEYTAYYDYQDEEEVDETRFNRYVNLGITAEDMLFRLQDENIDPRDLRVFSYPPVNELKNLGVRSVCLGSYIPWDVKKQFKIIQEELGWQGDEVENVPPQYSYEKIECHLQGVRDYIKYLKRGYSRPSHLASIDIRNGRLSRDESLEMIKDFEGRRPPSLDIFLKYVGLTESEFMSIVRDHQVSPWEANPAEIRDGKKTHDFEQWLEASRES